MMNKTWNTRLWDGSGLYKSTQAGGWKVKGREP